MDILDKLRAHQSMDDAVNQELDLDYPKTIYGEAADEIERLRAELARVSGNAARYNWLKKTGRAHSKKQSTAIWPRGGKKADFHFIHFMDDLDKSVDDAMIDEMTRLLVHGH